MDVIRNTNLYLLILVMFVIDFVSVVHVLRCVWVYSEHDQIGGAPYLLLLLVLLFQ